MSSAIPFLQPNEFKSLNTSRDNLDAEVVHLRLVVDDLTAIIATQNEQVEQLQNAKATIYEQARRDADARLDLITHIGAELWRQGDSIGTQDRDGNDLTLDALFDVDVPQWMEQVLWAAAQVLRSPECLVAPWLRSIERCLSCARNGHRCDVAPCGYHHDPNGCDECAEIVAGAGAESANDSEQER